MSSFRYVKIYRPDYFASGKNWEEKKIQFFVIELNKFESSIRSMDDQNQNIFISHLWSIRNITKKLQSPRQPSINSPECANAYGARWSLSFFPFDRRIDDEEYTSFRLNLCTCPPLMDQSHMTVQLSIFYCTGVYMRRKTFQQRFTVKDEHNFTQVIFRYSTKTLLRQLRRNKDDNLLNDTLQICVVVYFGDAPADTS